MKQEKIGVITNRIGLMGKIAAKATKFLEFIGIDVQKTSNGTVATLMLAEPIELVRGTLTVPGPNGENIPVNARNVTEIKVYKEDLEKFDDDFNFDEDTDYGTYEGTDLVLDVDTKRQVWLRSETFANFVRTQRVANNPKAGLAKLLMEENGTPARTVGATA
jgi:hypothetical protein